MTNLLGLSAGADALYPHQIDPGAVFDALLAPHPGQEGCATPAPFLTVLRVWRLRAGENAMLLMLRRLRKQSIRKFKILEKISADFLSFAKNQPEKLCQDFGICENLLRFCANSYDADVDLAFYNFHGKELFVIHARPDIHSTAEKEYFACESSRTLWKAEYGAARIKMLEEFAQFCKELRMLKEQMEAQNG